MAAEAEVDHQCIAILDVECRFLLGFVFPLMWYYATILYFGNYYRKDPRERSGLAASAIAALICSIATFITVAAILF